VRFKADINGDTMGVWIRPERIESIEQWDAEVCDVTLFSGKIYRIYGSMDSLSRKIDLPPVIPETPVVMNTNKIFKDPEARSDRGDGTIVGDIQTCPTRPMYHDPVKERKKYEPKQHPFLED
jgi:hypothetical protein